MAPAPGSAAGALNGPDAVADRPAGQRDKLRKCVVPPLAQPRSSRSWEDRSSVAVLAPVKAIEPASRCPPLKFTLLRINEYLCDRAASFGSSSVNRTPGVRVGDRGEWAAIFGWRLGLGVEEIEMARPAPQPDEQDRSRLRGLGRCQCPRAGRRQGERGGKAAQHKRPASHPLTAPARKTSNVNHPHGPLCSR